MSRADHPSRDTSADVLRAWGIWGVITIHAGDLALPAPWHEAISAYFRWAVPAFIVLSAYFSVRSLHGDARTFTAFTGQRLAQLAMPFVFYSSIYFVMSASFATLTPLSALTRHFSGYGWAGQYFFIVLFQLVPLFWVLSRFKISLKGVMLVFLVQLTVFLAAPSGFHDHLLLRQLNDRPAPYWLAYVVLGAWMAQHELAWRSLVRTVPRPLALLVVLASPLLIVISPGPYGNDSPYTTPAVLVTTFLLVPMSWAAFDARWLSKLSYVGRHSLVIFCLNPLFTELLRQGGFVQATSGSSVYFEPIFQGALVGALVVACCLATGELLKRTGLRAVVS